MDSRLFTFSGESVSPVSQSPFANEDELQGLIARNPGLLTLDSDPVDYRLYLVRREQAVSRPGNTENYIDILFVDSEAVPVIVEAKMRQNSEIHRAVIGQILSYAAWVRSLPVDTILSGLSENEKTSVDFSSDAFVKKLSSNLSSSRFRLIIAADSIPEDLESSISFLNGSMPGILLYGVSISRYSSDNGVLLSREVVGANEYEAPDKTTGQFNWTIESICERLSLSTHPEYCGILKKIVDFAQDNSLHVRTGSGRVDANIILSKGSYPLAEIYFCTRNNFHGTVYLRHANFTAINNSLFPDKESLISFLSGLSFSRSFFKPGINYVTFEFSLLAEPVHMDDFLSLFIQK